MPLLTGLDPSPLGGVKAWYQLTRKPPVESVMNITVKVISLVN